MDDCDSLAHSGEKSALFRTAEHCDDERGRGQYFALVEGYRRL